MLGGSTSTYGATYLIDMHATYGVTYLANEEGAGFRLGGVHDGFAASLAVLHQRAVWAHAVLAPAPMLFARFLAKPVSVLL